MVFYSIFDEKEHLKEYRSMKKWKHYQNGTLTSLYDIKSSSNEDMMSQVETLISSAGAIIILVGKSTKTMPEKMSIEIELSIKHSKNIIAVHTVGNDPHDPYNKLLPTTLISYPHILQLEYSTPRLKQAEEMACTWVFTQRGVL